MIMLRKYKSVVFWLIFVSLWIVGCDLRCNDEDEDENKKKEKTSGNNVNIKNNKIIKENYNSNTNIKNGSNKRDTNRIRSGNKKPNNYTNINNLNSKQNIPTVNNFVQNNSKVQNMNQIRINNQFNNNPVPVRVYNPNMNMNNPQGNMFPLSQNIPTVNKSIQNQVHPQNQNQKQKQNVIFNQGPNINPNPFYNQLNNNNQPVANIGLGSIQSMNNMNMNPNQNNKMPMMNNFMQNNNQVFPINQNQNQAAKKPGGPISTYKDPTLIGLNNIGSTCYKNAVLQCLSQTKDLTNYFLNDDNYDKIINNNIAKKNPRAKTLCPIYYNLIKNLWKKNATFKSFSPYEFMNSIGEMTKNGSAKFGLYEAGDAKDFIIYILEKMHAELRQPIKNKFWELGPNDKLNQYDKNNAFLHFLDEFQQDTSIVSELFYGFNETTNVCQFCKNRYNPEPICYNYGIFNILIFPLEEVRKYREQMMQMTNTNINIGATNNVVYLFECFFYNQKTDFFTAYGPNGIDNRQHCNICRQTYDSAYTTKIFVSPNILVLILNRGKGNVFNIKLNFPLHFDSTQFVLNKNKDEEIYNLYGVITHLGESGPSGHFIASCKSPVNGNWYRYNDGIVNPINDVQKDVIDYETPYILFYEKQNN